MSGNAIRFYLDGTQYDSPDGWMETSTEVSVDHNSQIIAIDYTQEYTWHGGAFTYLYNKALSGACELVDVLIEIESDGLHELNGVIFLPSIVFNETERSCTCKVEDDAFSARIQNNKSTEIDLGSETSKNGVAISTVRHEVSVFKPSDGTYYTDEATGFKVYWAFSKLVHWMSDFKVGFKSDYFNTGDGSNAWITSAPNLRGRANAEDPTCSFKQLYDTFRALRNIAMGFERINGAPYVVIEHISYFRASSNAVIISDAHETELSFIQDLLYSRVEVGGEILRDFQCDSGNTACDASNNILNYGFEREVYPITGECNRDQRLDLSIDSKFIVDTNKIQEVVEFESEAYDDKVFIIETDTTLTTFADKSDPLNLDENWYNEAYTNRKVIERYQDYLTGSLTAYGVNNGVHQFQAEKVGGILINVVQAPAWTNNGIVFDDETTPPNFDQDGAYDNVTGEYTPGDEGAYKFQFTGIWQSITPPTVAGNIITFRIQIDHYDSGGTLLTTYNGTQYSQTTNFGATAITHDTDYISMDENDYLKVRLETQQSLPVGTHPAQVQFDDFTWLTTDVRAVQIVGQTNTGNLRAPLKTSTNFPLSIEEGVAYLNDTKKTLRIQNQNIDRSGWVHRFKQNLYTGESEIEMISNG
jgi:hypothetical protein